MKKRREIITIKLELKKPRYQQHFNIEPNLVKVRHKLSRAFCQHSPTTNGKLTCSHTDHKESDLLKKISSRKITIKIKKFF